VRTAHNHRIHQKNQGFSLIETVIVMVVITVFIALAVTSLKLYEHDKKQRSTRENTEQITLAINSYLKEYGALPCPAPMRTTSPTPVTSPDFGRQVNCTAAAAPTKTYRVAGRDNEPVHIGTIPARDLGLPLSVMVDSWGNLFTYAVTEKLTVPSVLDLPEATNPGLHAPLLVNADGNQYFIVQDLDETLPENHYEIFFTNFDPLPAAKSAIRNGNDLILSVKNNNDHYVLTLIDYFSQTPVPHLILDINDEEDCGSNTVGDDCLTVNEITAALFDAGNLAHNLAAIEIIQNNQTLSAPNPVDTGDIDPGHMPFVILSHGPTGAGAHNLSGTLNAACPTAGSAADRQNCDFSLNIATQTNGVPDQAVFRVQDIKNYNLASQQFYDDVVSYALKSPRVWPPHQWCDPPGPNTTTGLQFQNPDLSWGDCHDIKGEIGPMGPQGDTGTPGGQGPSGANLNLSDAACTEPDEIMQGLNPDQSLVCVDNLGASPIPPMTLTTSVVTVASSNAGDAYRDAIAECPADMMRVGCGGSRHHEARDTFSEEDGGYIGTIINGPRGCKTGIDGGGGGSQAIAFAYCIKIAP
jgi:prepilin-type N-terminal cleavage/methylation domain-containing protein